MALELRMQREGCEPFMEPDSLHDIPSQSGHASMELKQQSSTLQVCNFPLPLEEAALRSQALKLHQTATVVCQLLRPTIRLNMVKLPAHAVAFYALVAPARMPQRGVPFCQPSWLSTRIWLPFA